jgi:hypothetical protein
MLFAVVVFPLSRKLWPLAFTCNSLFMSNKKTLFNPYDLIHNKSTIKHIQMWWYVTRFRKLGVCRKSRLHRRGVIINIKNVTEMKTSFHSFVKICYICERLIFGPFKQHVYRLQTKGEGLCKGLDSVVLSKCNVSASDEKQMFDFHTQLHLYLF